MKKRGSLPITDNEAESNKGSPCAGLYCENKGVHKLRILYVNRSGRFCNECKSKIEKWGLVIENLDTKGVD